MVTHQFPEQKNPTAANIQHKQTMGIFHQIILHQPVGCMVCVITLFNNKIFIESENFYIEMNDLAGNVQEA